MKAHRVAPPVDCETLLPGFDFADAYEVPAAPGLDAPAAVKGAFGTTPAWIRLLMGLRNRMGGAVGLKPAPASGFPVVSQSPEQVVLGFNDRHLDFRVVVTVIDGKAAITTIVRRHNVWGRAYLAVIMPFHNLIAARMAAGIG